MLLAIGLAGSGCSGVSEFNPVDSEEIRGRNVLVLPSTSLPPLPKNLQEMIQEQFESDLVASPHLGRVVTRQAFLEATPQGSPAWQDFQLLGETLSVLSMTDRETSAPFGEAHDIQLLAQVQLIQVPCELCENGSLLGMIAALVDPAEGKLLWRVHFTLKIEYTPSAETLEGETIEMAAELGDMLAHLLAPKWHRSRFNNLRKTKS